MKNLYPKEEEIMYAIWDIGHPCAISEIMKKHPELKRNTVAKVITILEHKGYLKVDSIVKTTTRTGRAYTPIISKKEYEEQKELLKNIVESSNIQSGILKYCMTLVNKQDVSEEFFKEVDKLLESLKNQEE
ncbi:BlaI/MecI/CopY family transcriptional regulator [Ruminococcus sp. OA3]|uniref:BlaI/MecI/CopY family transcriptional regulator n=1 Tax=Ruminococcus sp. OA3 TaxID=2914164 RepID=UPI001F06AB2F|nr:BlaI/MecI/CopY family transcriptional regulator [Ruminococcus sp. OA3]